MLKLSTLADAAELLESMSLAASIDPRLAARALADFVARAQPLAVPMRTEHRHVETLTRDYSKRRTSPEGAAFDRGFVSAMREVKGLLEVDGALSGRGHAGLLLAMRKLLLPGEDIDT